MFDARKRFGSGTSGNSQQERTTGVADDDNIPESWVELAPSRTSLSSSVEAIMVESGTSNKDSRLSPVSLQSPHVEFESNLEQVKYRLAKDVLPSKNGTDWLWDWSSRPEAIPSRMMRHRGDQQIGSTLTTPPNSPEPESSDYEFRAVKTRKPAFFRFEVIFGLVVSNLVTFFIGVGFGLFLSRRYFKSGGNTTATKTLSYYYW
jgi:BCL2/adenovirus E1B protein-interacting protein 3